LLSDATTSLVRSGLPVGAELTYLGKRRLKDLLQPENIYQLSFPGLETGFAELRTVDAFPNNLPVQINSFIGRKKEIAEIKQSIMENRLITITGSGGTGKTRLSLQVAVDLLEYFQDGIWFVELSDIFDGKNIPQAIFSAMQMNEPKGMPPTQALIDCLKYKNTLLVLDNCEQVLRDCANIAAELLESVPALKIIATSREAMKVNGELSYRIPSLSIPNRESPLSSEQLAEYESVQLFVARARLVSKQFFIHAGNAWALEQICHRLDGMPFPIELAAALTRLMPVEQIAELLNEDFGILVNDSPVAMPRSQTMRASLDWSYRLLSKDEKKLLRSLSVFRGGWTLDAIGAVCAAQEKADIGLSQKLLKPLVDKSLVIFQEDKRYHMLETTRQYAGEKLKKSGKAEILKRRHAEYFLAVLRQHQTDYPRFQVEWHNILSAGEYFCAAGQMEGLAELIFLVAEPLIVSGSLSAGLDFLEKAILLARTRGEPRFLVLFLNQVGRFSFEQSEFERAGRSFDESISLNLAGSLDEHALAEAYYYQSWIHAEKEELPQAVELLEKSRQLYTRLGDDAGLADVFYLDGYMNFYGDDLLKVHVLLLSALNLFERLHSQMGKLKCLHLLSFVFVEKYKRERSLQDAIVEAEKFARAALVLSETLGELNYRASLFHLLAEITAARGNYEDSYHHALESMQLSLKFGDKKLNAQTALHLCRIFVEQKKYQQALDWGSQALQSFKNLDDARGMAHVYKQFYLAQRGLDHSQEAMLAYHESRRLYEKLNDVAQIKVLEEMRKSA
jgi:predicted ATPase